MLRLLLLTMTGVASQKKNMHPRDKATLSVTRELTRSRWNGEGLASGQS